jgi:RNA polymerase sigma-70 factor, ECF subfamily
MRVADDPWLPADATRMGSPAAADERMLVRAAADGDPRALEELLTRHRDMMRAVCHRVCGDPHTADEALQLALIAAWRGLPRFDRRSRLSTWLYRIAYNASLGVLRAGRRHPAVPLDGIAMPGRGGHDHAQGVADAQTLRWALLRIPTDFRGAVVLRDLCGCSYQEVAEIQGVRAETAKTRIARGRQALAALLAASQSQSGAGG